MNENYKPNWDNIDKAFKYCYVPIKADVTSFSPLYYPNNEMVGNPDFIEYKRPIELEEESFYAITVNGTHWAARYHNDQLVINGRPYDPNDSYVVVHNKIPPELWGIE